MIRSTSEHSIQCLCVRWFRAHYPDYKIFAIPNGGARNESTGAMLKKEGVTAGVPDLHIPVARGEYHGLWVEMKKKGGVVRPSQRAMMNYLTREGYKCAVCYCFEEFMQTIYDYFNEQ